MTRRDHLLILQGQGEKEIKVYTKKDLDLVVDTFGQIGGNQPQEGQMVVEQNGVQGDQAASAGATVSASASAQQVTKQADKEQRSRLELLYTLLLDKLGQDAMPVKANNARVDHFLYEVVLINVM